MANGKLRWPIVAKQNYHHKGHRPVQLQAAAEDGVALSAVYKVLKEAA